MLTRYTMFAGYNAWCNERLYDATARVDGGDYRADRGAFFKSLHGTLNHLLVGDRIWMQRFTGQGEIPSSLNDILYDDFTPVAFSASQGRCTHRAVHRNFNGRRSQENDPLSNRRRPAGYRAGTSSGARSFFQPSDAPPRPSACAAECH